MSLTRIGSIGINTGIAFAGVTTIVTLNTANDALSIGATVNVGSGITLGKDGDVFFTGIATGNASGLTALNASNISSGTVPTARLGSGTASSSTFLRGDSTFQTVNTDLVSDTSPQLGGDLDSNTNDILLNNSGDIALRWQLSGTNKWSIFQNTAGGSNHLEIFDNNGSESSAKFFTNGQVELYHNGTKKFETESSGCKIDGSLELTANLVMSDNDKIRIGNSEDLEIYHDGSHSYIDNTGTGNLYIKDAGAIRINTDSFGVQKNDGSESIISGTADGAVELYYDNTKRFETLTGGAKVTGELRVTTDLVMNAVDNQIIYLGAGNDLQIFHDGSNTGIINTTGGLYIRNNGAIHLQPTSGGEEGIKIVANAQVELYNDNSKKLETQSYGINVQGVNSYDAAIKIHGQPTIGRSYWGYGNNQSYTGTLVGRTDSSTASTIFMGVDVTGNAGGLFGGLGSEIVFRRDHIFTTPNAANNNFVTCMRFGRATSTEGAVAFTNGLMFGNDQADANIISDYEEGTWVPQFRTSGGGSATPLLTFSSRGGRYIKVGRLVYVSCSMSWYTKHNSGSGLLLVENLPYTISSSEKGSGGAPAFNNFNVPTPSTISSFATELSNGTTYFYAGLVSGDNSGWVNLDYSAVNNSGNYRVQFCYEVD